MVAVPPQWTKGTITRQAHVALPPGTVEDELGREGFYGPASQLYRRHPPTSWTSFEGDLRPHMFDTDLAGAATTLPVPLLENTDVRIGWWVLDQGRAAFLRDADGDALYFVHEGAGVLGTEFGPLPYEAGDFLVVPRSVTHRFDAASATRLLVVEALLGAYGLPERGLLGRHALFDPAVLEVPEPEPVVDEAGPFELVVTRGGRTALITYDFHPFDAIGWKGDVAPMRLHAADFRPVTSARYHIPPSAHTVFQAPGFVVCMFAPRPLETDPESVRVPFYHRNVDYDEVIFFHSGEFFSRAGKVIGKMSFHPAGLHHGPQPAAVKRSDERGPGGMTSEIAINIDARRPLDVAASGASLCDEEYIHSWKPVDAVRA